MGEQLLQVVDIAKGLSPQIEFYGKRKEREEREDHGNTLRVDTKVKKLFTATVEKKRMTGDFITSVAHVKANINAYVIAQLMGKMKMDPVVKPRDDKRETLSNCHPAA